MIKRTNAVFRDVYSRDVLVAILALHFPGARLVADLTWGKGAFWNWEHGVKVMGFDVAPRLGCSVQADVVKIPLRDGAVDLAVFDPPHLHVVGSNSTLHLDANYGYLRSQADIHDLYAGAVPEIRRIAGVGAIIKFTDMVESGRFMPTHMLFAAAAAPTLGWPCDLAILDSGGARPMRPNQRVLHLRHAHSYFLIYKWDEREPRSPFWEKAV